MKVQAVSIKPTTLLSGFLVAAVIAICSATNVHADPIPADAQAKVDSAKKKLVDWSSNPVVVAAIKESNAKGGLAGVTNAKWDDMADTDAAVKGLTSSVAGKQVTKWETDDTALNKIILRDEKGNAVAYSSHSGKPILYNNATRAPFKNGLAGVWADKEAKPDPTTQKKSVQVSAPVMDGGKAIGVIQAAVELQ